MKMPEEIKQKWLARMIPDTVCQGEFTRDGKLCALGHLVVVLGGTINRNGIPVDKYGIPIGDETDVTMPSALYLNFGQKEEILQLNDDPRVPLEEVIEYIMENV